VITRRQRLAAVVSVLIALAVLVASSGAQEDLTKALVGRWEGDVQIVGVKGNPDQNRTLVIESVTQSDGQWTGKGKFGITGKGLGPVQIEIEPSGGRPSIRFVTGANATVRLQLADEKHLVGTRSAPGAGVRGSQDRPVRLERILVEASRAE
jgi:hypothetical protein